MIDESWFNHYQTKLDLHDRGSILFLNQLIASPGG